MTNVYMSNNEFSIPGVISDPVNAHTGYFVNPTVIDMLICGMDTFAARPCPVPLGVRSAAPVDADRAADIRREQLENVACPKPRRLRPCCTTSW